MAVPDGEDHVVLVAEDAVVADVLEGAGRIIGGRHADVGNGDEIVGLAQEAAQGQTPARSQILDEGQHELVEIRPPQGGIDRGKGRAVLALKRAELSGIERSIFVGVRPAIDRGARRQGIPPGEIVQRQLEGVAAALDFEGRGPMGGERDGQLGPGRKGQPADVRRPVPAQRPIGVQAGAQDDEIEEGDGVLKIRFGVEAGRLEAERSAEKRRLHGLASFIEKLDVSWHFAGIGPRGQPRLEAVIQPVVGAAEAGPKGRRVERQDEIVLGSAVQGGGGSAARGLEEVQAGRGGDPGLR